ncbi:MAG: fasciclin domain-containing protein [Bacteroidota bacterium]|nr:fasciclin domain-containing protein [Bacteroidota bacterium]
MKKLFLSITTVLAIGLFSTRSIAQTTTPAAPASGDVITTVSTNADYQSFGLILRAANLGAALKDAGPYTIFAPNNTAFNNLTPDVLDRLFQDPAKLTAFLKHHIVLGKYDKAGIIKALSTKMTALKTLDGQTLTLALTASKNLELTDSDGNKTNVIAFDINASNGVIIGVNHLLFK